MASGRLAARYSRFGSPVSVVVVREVRELLVPLQELRFRLAPHADVVHRHRQHLPLPEHQRIAGGFDAALRSVLAVLAHLHRGPRGRLAQLRDEAPWLDSLGAEEIGERDAAQLLARIPETSQRRRVRSDDFFSEGVEDQRGGRPLVERRLARGIGA